jgi:hypothetical protein
LPACDYEVREDGIYIPVDQTTLDGYNMQKVINFRVFDDHYEFLVNTGWIWRTRKTGEEIAKAWTDKKAQRLTKALSSSEDKDYAYDPEPEVVNK